MIPESKANGRAETPRASTPSRRQLFALSAALAGTVLTAGAAIAGLTRTPGAPPASTPTVEPDRQPDGEPDTAAPGGARRLMRGVWATLISVWALFAVVAVLAWTRQQPAGAPAAGPDGRRRQGQERQAPARTPAGEQHGRDACHDPDVARARPDDRRRERRRAGRVARRPRGRARRLRPAHALGLARAGDVDQAASPRAPEGAPRLAPDAHLDRARHGRPARRRAAPRPDTRLRLPGGARSGSGALASDRGRRRRRHRLADAHARALVPVPPADRTAVLARCSTTRASPASRSGSATR